MNREPEEVWRPVPNHDGYEASSTGRIRSSRQRRYLRKDDILKQFIHPNGYSLVSLSGKVHLAHRLVCFSFHGDPPIGKTQVAHGNGIRRDNRAENLRWATPSENCLDRRKHGTWAGPRGERQGHSILKSEQVQMIRAMRVSGHMQKDIAAEFGVSRSAINSILNGYNWRYL